ncbi:MAG: SDR family oxidoreductase [Chloroflexi bacterium]|nr:SDR family oxidoreductase [Chloroflexota bacterium]
MFSLEGKTAVVTGGGGVLCTGISCALAQAGAKVAVLERREEKAVAACQKIEEMGGQALAVQCDVTDKSKVLAAADKVMSAFGKVDILINGAGGNRPQATTSPDLSFFDISDEALQQVFNLNLTGTLLPSQVFGRYMAEARQGTIVNISSLTAFRPLTRIPAYSTAKAAVNNFTQWLAVHMAQEYSPSIRVNAIAPGFFMTKQNRFLLTDEETGELTPRGKSIISHTPMARFGVPEDLISAVLWLVSPSASFVTGIVVCIDGGFSAFSGV